MSLIAFSAENTEPAFAGVVVGSAPVPIAVRISFCLSRVASPKAAESKPSSMSALRLATLVVEVRIKGAVPWETAEVRTPPSLRVELMVELALMKIPAIVDVGVKAVPAKVDSQGEEAQPVPRILPEESVIRHWERMEGRVRAETWVLPKDTVPEVWVKVPVTVRLVVESSLAPRYLKSATVPAPSWGREVGEPTM